MRVPARGRWRWWLTSRWGRGCLALGAGALPVLAFPAPSLWWCACVVLVPWMLLIRSAPTGRRAALDGWLGGTGFLLALQHWLLPNLHVFLLLLAALLGLLWAPWGRLVRRLLGGSPGAARLAAAVALVPAGWLMVELVRSWEYLGGPWGLLGTSQWQVPAALRLASVGGVWLVGAVIVAVNTAVTALVAVSSVRVWAVGALAGCAAVVGATWTWAPAPGTEGSVRVALVQPGVLSGPAQRFDRGEELTRQLAARHPDVDLVVWAESSVGYDLQQRPDIARRLAALSRQTGAPLLVNVDARSPDRGGILKSAVLIGPRGPTGQRYDKMRLVPFGEYIPFRPVLGWVTWVGRAAGEDRIRGEKPVVMTSDGLRVGPLVSFETSFPDISRELAEHGAQLLVGQSSTSTFQESWAPRQLASLAALRAAESRRPMVHSTLTGISAVFDPGGELVGEPLGTDRSGFAVRTVPLASGNSAYVRAGDWVVWAALAGLAAFAGAELYRGFRRQLYRGFRRLRRSARTGP